MGKFCHEAALRPWNCVPALAADTGTRAGPLSYPRTVRFVMKSLFFSINIGLLRRAL